MAKQTTQPQPAILTPEAAEAREAESLWNMVDAVAGSNVKNKMAFMGDIRQKLAQVADEAEKNGEDAAQTDNLADASATRIYQARIAGMISADETSALLVDVFGAEPKKDGTPGKSPRGKGKAIRGRVVRLVQGYDFINGGDGGRFYEPFDREDVAPLIRSIGRTKKVVVDGQETLVADGPSLWTAYKQLGDMKSQMTTRLPFAFDPKKIASLVDSLSEAGARDKLIGNPSLIRAYKALFDQLQIISHVDASEAEAVKAALGGNTEPVETETETDEGEQVAA